MFLVVGRVDSGTLTLEDAVYNLEPANAEDSSLTSPHYVIVADGQRAPNTSRGTQI